MPKVLKNKKTLKGEGEFGVEGLQVQSCKPNVQTNLLS